MCCLVSVMILYQNACMRIIPTSELKKYNTIETNVFPQVSGLNLMGETINLPESLVADKTVLIVAFERWQQSLVDPWYAAISTLESPTIAYYEVPIISKLNPLVRWWIYEGMRKGIVDEQMRRKVLTLHLDKDEFKKYLKIEDESSIYILICDRDGQIINRWQGAYNEVIWQDVKDALTQ